MIASRLVGRSLVGLALVSSGAFAQLSVQQTLKDTWVASSSTLSQVDYNGVAGGGLVTKNPGDASRNFQAIAFALPTISSGAVSARDLIAVDGTKLVRFANGSNETAPAVLLDAGGAPSNFNSVNTVAVTPSGTVLFSGYSKPKKVFELWELTPNLPANDPARVRLRSTGTPQLTDAVFVPAEDVVAGSLLSGGGLLAAGGRQLLFFPAAQSYLTFQVLLDARSLPLKGSSQLTGVDLVRQTDTLMIATSERTLLTTAVTPGIVTTFASIPDRPDRACSTLRTQRLLVRSARNGSSKTSVVSDFCGQVLRYDYSDVASQGNLPSDTKLSPDGLLALAVGEGNEVLCNASDNCALTDGFTANIQTQFDSTLLVLQFNNLCDRRVARSTCSVGDVDSHNALIFNSLLPKAIRDQLAAEGVTITIPPYMFGAGFNGRFGALIIQADSVAATSEWLIDLQFPKLLGFELGVRDDFQRTTPLLDLLRQDVAAYAPDHNLFPTVRGFEATPSGTGKGSYGGSLRGASVVLYGLQFDLNPAGPRIATGGLPLDSTVNYGASPTCDLNMQAQSYHALPDAQRFFANLAACLFADEQTLLTSVIPQAAIPQSGRDSLLAQLSLVEDKLIKALNATGPNSGSQTFQAVASQLDHFDQAVAAAVFAPDYVIYKNELAVRSKVFRFHLLTRTYPSLPPNGF